MNAKPEDPPLSLDATLEWISYLQSRGLDARRGILRELSEHNGPPSTLGGKRSSRRVWIEFLEKVFQKPELPLMGSLQNHLLRGGIPREKVDRILMFLSEQNWVQEQWEEWGDVNDRRELRLRLYYLSRIEELDEGLIPFLTFFFRASDPALYQQAAVAMGQHLSSRVGLRDYFHEYLDQRESPLSFPLGWNGQRPRRRVQLVFSSYVGRHPHQSFPGERLDLPPVPFACPGTEEEPGALPPNSADASVYLTCLRLMNRTDTTRQRIQKWIQPVLERFATDRSLERTRDLQENWGRLIVSECDILKTSGASDPEIRSLHELCVRMHETLRRDMGRRDGFGSLFRGWRIWDEYLRSLTSLPPWFRKPLLKRIQTDVSEDDFDLVRLRLLTWLGRGGEGNSLTAGRLRRELTSTDRLSPLVSRAFGCLPGGYGCGDPPLFERDQNEVLESFARLMEPLTGRERWRSRVPRTRALIAFLVLDVLGAVEPPASQVESVLHSLGFAPLGHGSFPGITESPSTRNRVQVISRLQTWETADSESFLDADMIHKVGGIRLLLSVVPTSVAGDVLPVLADAFEHQIRVSLKQPSTPDITYVLGLITIRDPHPKLFDELLRVCAHRSYRDGRDREVPLQNWIEFFRKQVIDADELSGEEGIEEIGNFDSLPLEQGMEETAYVRRTRTFRRRIREVPPASGDPREVLHRFSRLIGVPHEGRNPRTDSLLGMLRYLHLREAPVLQSGFPALRSENGIELEHRVEERMARLEKLNEKLGPHNWTDVEELDQIVREVRQLLDGFVQTVIGSLPYLEERAFECLIQQLDRFLLEWVQDHEALWKITQSYFEGESLDPGRLIGDLVEEIDSRWDSDLGAEIKTYAYDELLRVIRPNEESVLEPWSELSIRYPLEEEHHRVHLSMLDAALKRTRGKVEPVFREVLFESWKQLLETSMEGGRTGWTVELLTRQRYRPVRLDPDAVPPLEAAREWALDRYRLGLSRNIGNTLAELKSEPPPTWAGELRRFAAHYSPVWLALLVGAVLMLDFGDPWTSMAEQGDVNGILFTFVLGVIATFLYLFVDLRTKGRKGKEESVFNYWGSQLLRASSFLVVCLVYTFLVVGFLWYLLSGTDQVVGGPFAFGHVVVWTGFALFFGVFMGLLAQQT